MRRCTGRAVIGWRVKRGQVLCRQGETGGTAFILLRGRFGYWRHTQQRGGGLLAWITPRRREGPGAPAGLDAGACSPGATGEMCGKRVATTAESWCSRIPSAS